MQNPDFLCGRDFLCKAAFGENLGWELRDSARPVVNLWTTFRISRRESLRPEDLGPFVAGKVGGDQDGAPLVALAEDLEEQLRPGGRQGDESQLVDDQLVQAGKVLAVHLKLNTKAPDFVHIGAWFPTISR